MQKKRRSLTKSTFVVIQPARDEPESHKSKGMSASSQNKIPLSSLKSDRKNLPMNRTYAVFAQLFLAFGLIKGKICLFSQW